MADTIVSNPLQALVHIISRMLELGEEVLDEALDTSQLDEVLTRLDERSSLYTQIQQYEQQNPGFLAGLLNDADGRVRRVAEAMRGQLMEIVNQNALIEERLRPIRDGLFQNVELIQLKLHLTSTYQPPRWSERRGALVDSRE